MNTAQQRALALDAFRAGAANGGDSAPNDHDYADIQQSILLAFESWWTQRQRCKAGAR